MSSIGEAAECPAKGILRLVTCWTALIGALGALGAFLDFDPLIMSSVLKSVRPTRTLQVLGRLPPRLNASTVPQAIALQRSELIRRAYSTEQRSQSEAKSRGAIGVRL